MFSIGNYCTWKLIELLFYVLVYSNCYDCFFNFFFLSEQQKRHNEEVSSKELAFSTPIKSLTIRKLKSVHKQHLKGQKVTQF